MSAPSSDRAGIRQVIRALQAAGYTLVEVFDGEDTVPTTTESAAIEAIMAVDDATLFVRTPEGDRIDYHLGETLGMAHVRGGHAFEMLGLPGMLALLAAPVLAWRLRGRGHAQRSQTTVEMGMGVDAAHQQGITPQRAS